MAIDIYKGEFATAQDASKLIDINNLKKQCGNFNEAADKLNAIADKIKVLRSICNKDALSVDGYGMEDTIDFYEKNVRDLSLYLRDLSTNLDNDSQRIINIKQVIFNEEAKEENRTKTIQSEMESSSKLDEYTIIEDNSDFYTAFDSIDNNNDLPSNGGDING